MGVSSVTGPGRCGPESCVLLKLIWLIVIPQARGSTLGRRSPLPPLSRLFGRKVSAKGPIFPHLICNWTFNSLLLSAK